MTDPAAREGNPVPSFGWKELQAHYEVCSMSNVIQKMSILRDLQNVRTTLRFRMMKTENGLSERFPIGLKPLIEAWQLEDVQTYHDTHYYPGNALLYVIGDLPVEQMEKQLAQVMGKVRG